MSHNHIIYDADPHFSINPDTRAIKNESTTKTSLLQRDHNSERFTFELPRYIDSHDMSCCDKVEVHYINIDAATKESTDGVYIVDDLQIDPKNEAKAVCSWLISQNATQYAGVLNFLLRFVCLNEDGETVYAWHTAVFSGITISTGMFNGVEEDDIDQYADIMAQWEKMVLNEVDAKLEKFATKKYVEEYVADILGDVASIESVLLA